MKLIHETIWYYEAKYTVKTSHAVSGNSNKNHEQIRRFSPHFLQLPNGCLVSNARFEVSLIPRLPGKSLVRSSIPWTIHDSFATQIWSSLFIRGKFEVYFVNGFQYVHNWYEIMYDLSILPRKFDMLICLIDKSGIQDNIRSATGIKGKKNNQRNLISIFLVYFFSLEVKKLKGQLYTCYKDRKSRVMCRQCHDWSLRW